MVSYTEVVVRRQMSEGLRESTFATSTVRERNATLSESGVQLKLVERNILLLSLLTTYRSSQTRCDYLALLLAVSVTVQLQVRLAEDGRGWRALPLPYQNVFTQRVSTGWFIDILSTSSVLLYF